MQGGSVTAELTADVQRVRAGERATAELTIDVEGRRAGGRVTAELAIDVHRGSVTAGVEEG